MTKIMLALLGATALAAVGAGLLAYKYRTDAAGERDRRLVAELNLKAATDANALLSKELDDQTERAKITDDTTAKLAVTLSEIRAQLGDANAELAELRATDATVDDFLKLGVPAPLERLLDQ